MFLAILGLLFGGGIWGFGTEQGRSFFGGLFENIGNWLGQTFPGLRGLMGFISPSNDPEGAQREDFVRNGSMGLIRQGLQRFAGVPEEIVQAIAPDRETFNQFLEALGPDAVRSISRNQNIDTIEAAITPASISRVLGNPQLAPRVLDAAARLASRSGGTTSEEARRLQARITQSATQLLTDPAQQNNLREMLNRNPALFGQIIPLVVASRQAGGTTVAASSDIDLPRLLTNPVILEQLRSPTQQAALLQQLTTHGATLGIPAEAISFLRTPAQGGQGTNLSVVLTALSNPALRDASGELRPEARALFTSLTTGRPTAATLTPQLMELVRMNGSESVIASLRQLSLPASMQGAAPALAMLTPQNVSAVREALNGMDDHGRQRLGQMITSLASGGQPDITAITTLAADNKAVALRLLAQLDLSTLPPEMRTRVASAQQLSAAWDAQPSRATGRSNLDVMLAVAREPYVSSEAGRGLITQLTTGDTAARTTALLTALQDPTAAPVLRQLGQLDGAAAFGASGGYVGLLTDNNITRIRETLAGLNEADRTRLTGLLGGLVAEEPSLDVAATLTLLRNPSIRGLLTQLETDRLPPEMSAQIQEVRGYLSSPLLRFLLRSETTAPARTSSLQHGITGGDTVESGARVTASATPTITDSNPHRAPVASPSLA
ncbi:MAG: hypothetical protein K2Q12_06265 [Rickettsiales bacterium]|nr:hypothetical protein [Rickettsiales bacterium]